MALLFSYGTLQRPAVQQSTFGRLLVGTADQLVGFETASVPITDTRIVAVTGSSHYANVVFNGRPDSRVDGMAFEVTAAELEAADRYEREAGYVRLQTVLASHRVAWVYMHRSGSRPPAHVHGPRTTSLT